MCVHRTCVAVVTRRAALGERIARAREAQDMTQAELAAKVGVTSSQVSKWERGLSLLSARKLAKVSCVLGINIVELAELYAEAGQEDAVAARRDLGDLRRQHEAALAEMRQIVEAGRDINEQIAKEMAAMRDLFSQLPEVLRQMLSEQNHR